jgi:hypothetical protein
MPRGTAARSKTRYAVRLTVPRRGGWRAWGAVRADFERGLAAAADPAIASAEIASELRRGADYVRVTVVLTVVTTDVADALIIAWDAFCSAARDDAGGWEVATAAAQVQPEPSLAGVGDYSAVRACLRASRQRARDEVAIQLHLGGKGEHVAAFLTGDGDRVMGERAGDFLQRQPILANLNEVVQQLGFLTTDAAIQADQQTVQPSGKIFVITRVHAHHSGAGKGTWVADRPVRLRVLAVIAVRQTRNRPLTVGPVAGFVLESARTPPREHRQAG